MTTYKEYLTQAMNLLAEVENSIFLGQSVRYPGTGMFSTLTSVLESKLLELPVFENTQLGISTGLSLVGLLPISIFPRMNFLICALDQLVLHLDAIPRYSDGGYRPKVIIRTMVAHDQPLNPGEQHLGDYSLALTHMLRTVQVVRLKHPRGIVPAYREALEHDGSTILVEYAALYDEVG